MHTSTQSGGGPEETMKSLPGVGGSHRRQLHGVACLDHHSVSDNHRDVAVPDREVARTQRPGIDRGADILLLRQPRNVSPAS